MTTHYGRKVRRGREIERENAINSGHYVLPATLKGSALTRLGPIFSSVHEVQVGPHVLSTHTNGVLAPSVRTRENPFTCPSIQHEWWDSITFLQLGLQSETKL